MKTLVKPHAARGKVVESIEATEEFVVINLADGTTVILNYTTSESEPELPGTVEELLIYHSYDAKKLGLLTEGEHLDWTARYNGKRQKEQDRFDRAQWERLNKKFGGK